MCDTVGKVIPGIGGLFGKNSDRSPNEPQVVEYYPRTRYESRKVKTTYMEIGQVKETKAIVLSRPVWMWGGEMGVNECGVCIGNEAVFTKGTYGKDGLTGMDLLRIALERSETAEEALHCIIGFLETYGQGGNCGYDHDFYYDNAFLIMDRKEIYILETAGKEWVYKKTVCGAISNRLSIGTEGDVYSSAKCDFAKEHTEIVYSTFSKAANRRKMTGDAVEKATCLKDIFGALRQHEHEGEPFCKGSVGSPCMHFGGLVGDHTTQSMAVELLENGEIRIWITGMSSPCISLFKPYAFGETCETSKEYWMKAEQFHRSFLGKRIPQEYYEERDAIEEELLCLSEKKTRQELSEVSLLALEEEAKFHEKWSDVALDNCATSYLFRRNWKKKNQALK